METKNTGQKGRFGKGAAPPGRLGESSTSKDRKHGHATHHPGSVSYDAEGAVHLKQDSKAVLPSKSKPLSK